MLQGGWQGSEVVQCVAASKAAAGRGLKGFDNARALRRVFLQAAAAAKKRLFRCALLSGGTSLLEVGP